jgi:tocopherol cyclase
LQSNSFEQKNASLFISIAKIPWLGKFFIGFIAFIYFEGKFYKFATYNHSKLVKVTLIGNFLEIEIENRNFNLSVQAKSRVSGVLFAPKRGNMNRRIKESIDSEVSVQLKDKNGLVIFSDHSYGAGLEIIEEIFKYL